MVFATPRQARKTQELQTAFNKNASFLGLVTGGPFRVQVVIQVDIHYHWG
jgi:hypothetical protein